MMTFLGTYIIKPRVSNGEENIEFAYTASKMVAWSLMASVVTPLKRFSKRDWHLCNDTKTKLLLRTWGDIRSWIDQSTGETIWNDMPVTEPARILFFVWQVERMWWGAQHALYSYSNCCTEFCVPIYLFHQTVHKHESSKPSCEMGKIQCNSRVSMESLHIFLGISNHYQFIVLLCYKFCEYFNSWFTILYAFLAPRTVAVTTLYSHKV